MTNQLMVGFLLSLLLFGIFGLNFYRENSNNMNKGELIIKSLYDGVKDVKNNIISLAEWFLNGNVENSLLTLWYGVWSYLSIFVFIMFLSGLSDQFGYGDLSNMSIAGISLLVCILIGLFLSGSQSTNVITVVKENVTTVIENNISTTGDKVVDVYL